MRRTHGTPCRVCTHNDRAVIEVGLAEHRSITAMAKNFGMSIHSLYRHRQSHMPPALIQKILGGSNYAVENLEQLRTTEGERLLSHVVEVRRRLYANAEGAEKTGDFRAATLAYGKILESLTLIGRLLDRFTSSSRIVTNQLVVSPDYLRLRAALIQALAPYPEARQAVAKVLREAEVVEMSNGNENGRAPN